MSPYPTSVVIILTLITLLAASGTSLADSPPDNTIPIIGIIFYWWKWTPELLCEMSWMHFDGIEYEIFESQEDGIDGLMASIDSCGMYVVLNSADLNALAYMGDTACRAHYGPLGGSTAFIEVNENGGTIRQSYNASTTDGFIDSICVAVNNAFYDYYDQIWFYRFFDEPAANQRKWMYDPYQDYDDYFPSYLTQVTSKFSADSAGTYSWIKKLLEDLDSSIITSTVFAGAQRIYSTEDWAGAFHGPAVVNAHGRAEIVRGFCNMEYQDPSGSRPIDNSNDLVMVDIYPFRHVGTAYQDTASYTPSLGDPLNTWLLNHMEEAMDSTFLAAVQEGCEVLYWPQTFGIAGGASMWEEDPVIPDLWTIEYNSYFPYRIPTPAETRMHINLALLRQAQGLLPFCIATYTASSIETIPRRTTGLLDNDMIPFDAPFEEWAYTGRPQDSLSYIRPDSIEPFISSFDPLYSGPGPIPYNPGEQQRQDFLEWKFAPYGRLWNSLDDTFGEISIVAPELTQIHWWDGYEDEAWIGCPDSNGYIPFVQPEIRLFERDGSDFPYLFYVNRQCRQTANRMEIRVDDTDVPDADLSNRVLDHSRRFIIPVSGVRTLFFFQDTLGPGQARLVEFIDVTPGTAADLRITVPDIWAEVNSDTTNVYEFLVTAGDEIDIFAEVYNMGTYSVDSVVVTLSDVTSMGYIIGRDTLAFDGLDTDGYLTDTDTAFFEWTPTNPGIRRLKVSVASVTGEPDTDDNSASIVFLIQPEDYSTTVREDVWDMTEGGTNDWNTDDIEAVSTYWLATAWTDSVSGMFEGRLSTSIPGDDLRGDISLAIPSSSSDWIDSDDYSMLSFGMVSYNPNSNASVDNGCEVYIGFKDSHGTTHWCHVTAIRNGWDEWKVYGPFDLDDEFPSLPSWSGNDVQEFWLSFRKAKPEDAAEPIDIRLGWVKLTE